MKKKTYYYMCNHWTECGIGEAFPKGWYKGKYYEHGFSTIYTIEKTLDGIDKYNVVIGLELDSYSYEVVAKEAPELINKLKKYIRQGRVSIVGGTYAQPLGQDYGWESNIRHLTYGRRVVQEILDVGVDTFIVEEQWFHPQLPQLLKKSGFEYASLQCQNSGQVAPRNTSMIDWEGIDGSTITTIPANNIMVSCVKQYKGYQFYEKILESYEQPLLFQWIEVWTPGMDWGASVDPFEKGIRYIKEQGMLPISISDYMKDEENNIKKEKICIELNDGNYHNDWYQGGGWGYDGDTLMYLNDKVEALIATYETKRFIEEQSSLEQQKELDEIWKELLRLQNHDFSVARTYRAYTEDGVKTTAVSSGLRRYRALERQLTHRINAVLELGKNRVVFNHYNEGCVTTCLRVNTHENVEIVFGDSVIPCVENIHDGVNDVTVTLNVKPYSIYTVWVRVKSDMQKIEQCKQTQEIAYENIHVAYQGGWDFNVENKKTGVKIKYKAFNGSIGKSNEHDEVFSSLSSAHHHFSFALGGPKHCPDQTAELHAYVKGIEEDSLYISISVRSNLLTLHTTETPVAFAETKISINKQSKEVAFHTYIYTGVYLNMDAYATFTYSLEEAEVVRDYPFYEEKARVEALYPLTYIRVANKQTGFTLSNKGSRRFWVKDKTLTARLTKRTLFQDYHFDFMLKFDTTEAIDSLNFVKNTRVVPLVLREQQGCGKKENPFIFSKNPCVIVSQLFLDRGKRFYRLVNYSGENIKNSLQGTQQCCVWETDMEGKDLYEVDVEGMEFQPFEIKTLRLCENDETKEVINERKI